MSTKFGSSYLHAAILGFVLVGWALDIQARIEGELTPAWAGRQCCTAIDSSNGFHLAHRWSATYGGYFDDRTKLFRHHSQFHCSVGVSRVVGLIVKYNVSSLENGVARCGRRGT